MRDKINTADPRARKHAPRERRDVFVFMYGGIELSVEPVKNVDSFESLFYVRRDTTQHDTGGFVLNNPNSIVFELRLPSFWVSLKKKFINRFNVRYVRFATVGNVLYKVRTVFIQNTKTIRLHSVPSNNQPLIVKKNYP